MDEAGTFEIEISRKKTFLHFSLNSDFIFNSMEEVPVNLLRKLMLDNTTSKMGYWSLKDLEVGFVFSRMYNEELTVLTKDSLEVILNLLAEKCLSIMEELNMKPQKDKA